MTPPPPLPRCPSEAELTQTLRRWEDEARAFTAEVGDLVDDVELYLRHTSLRGWRFEAQQLQPLSPPAQGECYMRLFRGGHTVWGRFPLAPKQWKLGAQELLRAFPKTSVGFYRPPPPRHLHPRPTSFDPRMHEQLGDPLRLQRVAYALSDNTWHEGERFAGMQSAEGRLALHLSHRVVCNLQGSVSDSKVSLEASVRINQCFEDTRHALFCPGSFLPWALTGATLWRKRAAHQPAPHLNAGYRDVILHPRILEKLLRARLPLVCTHKHFEPNAQVGSPALTLSHEPKADGMVESAPFDDLGRPREPTQMITQGALTAPFAIDPLCAEWSPQGLRPRLMNFFVRPGQVSHAELLQRAPHTIQVENALIEPVGDLGPNAFTLRLTEALTTDGQLVPPNRYRLSGTIASTAEGPGLLEALELSREVIDTGSALLPFARCSLYLHPA